MRIHTAKMSAAICCMAFLATYSVSADDALTTLPLAGTWKFRLGAEGIGAAEKWFAL